mgnify:CR=1 FL=1|jgi:uncharacterized membrane protein YGL010W
MKTIEEQLARYKSVHLNQKNINTHFVGVPLIFLAVTVLLHLLPVALSINNVLNSGFTVQLTPAIILFIFVGLYYVVLHRLLGLSMLLYISLNVYVAHYITGFDSALYIAIGLFVIGWIIQFIGHHYERAKPAFVDDLNQLLIGPLFLMAEAYFMLGTEAELEAKITDLAIKKRKILETQKQI